MNNLRHHALVPRHSSPIASLVCQVALSSTFMLAPGCVSQSNYDAKVAELEQTREQLQATQAQKAAGEREASALQARLAKAQVALNGSKQSSDALLAKLDEVNLRATELQRLAEERQSVLSDLQGQLDSQLRLVAEFEALARDYGVQTPEELKRSLTELQQRVRLTESALSAAKADLERERRISSKLKSLIDAGKLSVHRRAGRLVIELPGDIHFDPGKAKLTEVGQATLAQLAPVLAAEQDRLFVVEGHTDNQPVRVSGFRNNWHLGATRAEVAREALVEGGVDGTRIAIASWADLLPACAESDEPSCRQRNRRVEVLLLPRFE